MSTAMGCIYMHTNTVTGKSYIGQTIKTMEQRFQDHIREAKRKGSNDTYFHKSLNKYSLEVWISEVLYANIPVKKLDHVESMCISQYDTYYSGYNMTLGGLSGKGQKISDITRKKLSKAGMGRQVSDYTKNKISKSNKGNRNRLGHTNSNVHRERISKSRVGIKNPGFKPWKITKPDGTVEVYLDITKKQYAIDNNLPIKAFSTRFGKDKAGKVVKTGPLQGWKMENVNVR